MAGLTYGERAGGEEAVEVVDGEEGGGGAEAVAGVDLQDPVDGVLAGGHVAASPEVVRLRHMAGLRVDEFGDDGARIGRRRMRGGRCERRRRVVVVVGDTRVRVGGVEVGGVLGAVEGVGGGFRRHLCRRGVRVV